MVGNALGRRAPLRPVLLLPRPAHPTCHPLICFPILTFECRRTFIGTRRSGICSRQRGSCRLRVGLRPHTYATLFGLYVATGVRTSEPLRLDRDDVDLVHGVLTIRDTKFGKSRYVPVHPSTQRALQRYARNRDRLCPSPGSASFFLSDRGRRLSDDMVRWTFIRLSRQIGLRNAGDLQGPRHP